jgi:hypothetical protein
VVGENVEEQGRDHRYCLLPADVPSVRLVDEEVLELAEGFILANLLLGDVELPGVSLGVPASIALDCIHERRRMVVPREGIGRSERDSLVLESTQVGDVGVLDQLVERCSNPVPILSVSLQCDPRWTTHGLDPVIRKVVGRGAWNAATIASHSSSGRIP